MNSYQLLPARASTGRKPAAYYATAIRHPDIQYNGESFVCGDRLHQGLLALCIAAAFLIAADPFANGQNSAANAGGGLPVSGPAVQPPGPGVLLPNNAAGVSGAVTAPSGGVVPGGTVGPSGAVVPNRGPATGPSVLVPRSTALPPNSGAMVPGSVSGPSGAVVPGGAAGPSGAVMPNSRPATGPSVVVPNTGAVGQGNVVAPSGAVMPGGAVGPSGAITPQTPLPPGSSRMVTPTIQSQGAANNGLQILQANPYYTATNNFYTPGTNGFATPASNNFIVPGTNGFGALTNR